MPRGKTPPPQNNVVRRLHCLAVLQENGDSYQIVFFSSSHRRGVAFEDWVTTGKFFREGETEYTRPYAVGLVAGDFLFNLDQERGKIKYDN